MGSLVESIKQAEKDKKRSWPCQHSENHNPGREKKAEKHQKTNSCSVSWLSDDECQDSVELVAKQEQEGQQNTPAAAPCQSAAFYSPWRISQIEESVRRLVKRAKDKVQQGVFAAPFEYFPLQEPAFQFADSHDLAPELRVFSLEMDDSGRRNFIVTTYDEFWKIYWQTVSAGRHHYEIIREGYPCHLYFDLEYKVEFNRGVDGQALVDAVIRLATQVLKERFDLNLNREGIMELDSSNSVKFSRHLVVLLDNHAFRCNAHVGCLVDDMCAEIWEEGSEFQELQVAKDDVGGKTAFIDKGVYSRNRAFRLVLSSKAGKDSFLQPTGRFRPVASMTRVFYDSLICNVHDGANLLAYFVGDPPVPALKRASGGRSPAGLAAAAAPKRGPSPFPEIEDFILSKCSQGVQDGVQGFVRDWQWWPQKKILVLNIGGNRFCGNIGRHHKSNGIYFVADVKEGTWFQKCHDPECRGFRSEIMALPVDLFRRIHEGFARAAATTNAGPGADRLFEDGMDDSALLQAVQEAEASHQRLATPKAIGSRPASL